MDGDKDKTKGEEVQEEVQRIRMTLKCRDTKPLEKISSEITKKAKELGYKTKGPVRIPTKILRITTRKSPCGEGTNTWDRFEMRIHKRVLDLFCPASVVKDITNIKIDTGVDVSNIHKSTDPFPPKQPAGRFNPKHSNFKSKLGKPNVYSRHLSSDAFDQSKLVMNSQSNASLQPPNKIVEALPNGLRVEVNQSFNSTGQGIMTPSSQGHLPSLQSPNKFKPFRFGVSLSKKKSNSAAKDLSLSSILGTKDTSKTDRSYEKYFSREEVTFLKHLSELSPQQREKILRKRMQQMKTQQSLDTSVASEQPSYVAKKSPVFMDKLQAHPSLSIYEKLYLDVNYPEPEPQQQMMQEQYNQAVQEQFRSPKRSSQRAALLLSKSSPNSSKVRPIPFKTGVTFNNRSEIERFQKQSQEVFKLKRLIETEPKKGKEMIIAFIQLHCAGEVNIDMLGPKHYDRINDFIFNDKVKTDPTMQFKDVIISVLTNNMGKGFPDQQNQASLNASIETSPTRDILNPQLSRSYSKRSFATTSAQLRDRIDQFKKTIGNNYSDWEKTRKEKKNKHQDYYHKVKDIQHGSRVVGEALDGYIQSSKNIKSGEYQVPSVEKEFKSAINQTNLEFGGSPTSVRDINKSEISVLKRNRLLLEHIILERGKGYEDVFDGGIQTHRVSQTEFN